MIIFLYGPDTYRSRRKLGEIVARYKNIHKTGMSFSDFSAEDDDFDDFQNAAKVVSMFEEKRLLVLRDFISSKDFADRFLLWEKKESIKDSKEIVLVFVDEAIDKRNALFRWFLKNAQCQEFDTLRGAQLNRWAKRFAAEKRARIEDAALYRLVAHTRGDLWAFESEIKKLKAYVSGSSISAATVALEIPSLSPNESKLSPVGSLGIIRNEDLDIFLRPILQAHIFSLVDAIANKDRSKAFSFLRGNFEAGDNGKYIFFMVAQQFRNIAIARDFLERGERNFNIIAKKASMHPFVAKRSLSFAERFNKEEIKKIYRKLVDLDQGIKTGKFNPADALENFILSPCGGPLVGRQA